MATCPRCFGALTENHRCPRGRFHRLGDALVSVGIGGVLGAAGAMLLVQQASTAVVIASAALGAVLSKAVRDAVTPRH